MKPLPLCMFVVASFAFPALAQEAGSEGSSADEIARKLADPGAAMVSVPFHHAGISRVERAESNDCFGSRRSVGQMSTPQVEGATRSAAHAPLIGLRQTILQARRFLGRWPGRRNSDVD